jgi:hypothetical protein
MRRVCCRPVQQRYAALAPEGPNYGQFPFLHSEVTTTYVVLHSRKKTPLDLLPSLKRLKHRLRKPEQVAVEVEPRKMFVY